MPRQGAENRDSVREFFWVFHLAIALVLWLIVISVLSVAACLVAAHYLWQPDPVAAMEGLMRYYLDQTTNPSLAKMAADGAYWSWFGWNGIDQAAREVGQGLVRESVFNRLFRQTLFVEWREPLTIAMYGIKLFGIRAAMLAMAAPAFVLVLGVALADGLVARYVRRENGAHESATRYHRAKRALTFGMVPVTAIVWLVAPLRLPLAVLFLPVATFCGLLVWLMAKYYKKYV